MLAAESKPAASDAPAAPPAAALAASLRAFVAAAVLAVPSHAFPCGSLLRTIAARGARGARERGPVEMR